MESLTDQYGHEDSLFVSDVPDYLHCIICTLVLRNPVQILQCGHKYCQVCFERVKEQAVRTGVNLLCPIDREVVDINEVRPDVGMGRIVGNLSVRCREHEHGCEWRGDLRELDVHHERCEYRIENESSVVTGREDVGKLMERVERCEVALEYKDKQIASLEFKLNQQEQQQQQQKLQQEQQKLRQEQQHQLLLNQIEALVKEVSQLKENYRQEEYRSKQLSEEVNFLRKEINSGQDDVKVTSKGASGTSHNGPPDNNKSKKTTIAPKNIVIQHHSGRRENTIISDNHHRVEFKYFSTVSAPTAVVPLGAKVWYEVHYLPRAADDCIYGQQIGWATKNLATSEECLRTGVGDKKDSYGFDPFNGRKWHGGHTPWGKTLKQRKGGYVGVALDTVKGEVWFSVNGNWNEPNGIAFNGVDTKDQFFPALSGDYATLEVNFDDREFRYGPPTSGFVKLIDVL